MKWVNNLDLKQIVYSLTYSYTCYLTQVPRSRKKEKQLALNRHPYQVTRPLCWRPLSLPIKVQRPNWAHLLIHADLQLPPFPPFQPVFFLFFKHNKPSLTQNLHAVVCSLCGKMCWPSNHPLIYSSHHLTNISSAFTYQTLAMNKV